MSLSSLDTFSYFFLIFFIVTTIQLTMIVITIKIINHFNVLFGTYRGIKFMKFIILPPFSKNFFQKITSHNLIIQCF